MSPKTPTVFGLTSSWSPIVHNYSVITVTSTPAYQSLRIPDHLLRTDFETSAPGLKSWMDPVPVWPW